MRNSIRIYNDTDRKRIPKKKLTDTIAKVLNYFNKTIDISIILVDEQTILELNKNFLKHNFVTDVISFDLSDDNTNMGEIYICISQAERQAKEFKVSLQNEILRLAIHGVLHILGFEDETPQKKKEMHKLENLFLT